MFQDLFEYFKVYTCFFGDLEPYPSVLEDVLTWLHGCHPRHQWDEPFFAGELIGRCEEGRSPGLPGKCEGDHSTGAGLHLHPAHPSQGPQGGSSMADIDHAPEIIRVLVRKSAN